MKNILILTRLPLFFLGIALLWVADRYLGNETYHLALRVAAMIVAFSGILLTLGLSLSAAKTGLLGESKSWRFASLWQILVYGGLVLYLVYRKAIGDGGAPDSTNEKLLLGAWLSALIFGFFFGAGTEWVLRQSGRGELAEPANVKRAGTSWLVCGMLLGVLVCLNFVGAKKDIQRDWSYLKTTSPSESTRNLLSSLTDDLTVALFYSPTNEVGVLVRQYYEAIAGGDSRVKLQVYDKDLQPSQAEAYRVPRNGQIVFDFKGKKARIDTGETLLAAKKTLKNLDAETQQRILEVSDDKQTMYFTRGHGEASWTSGSDANPLKSIKGLEGFLRTQNYNVKLFGVGEGSAKEVPADAKVVVIAGPDKPFQQAEVDALRAYIERGGHIMAFLDVDKPTDMPEGLDLSKNPLYDLLAEYGFQFDPTPLVNDVKHHVVTRSVADRWFIHTNIFTSHESVLSLSRHEERVEVIMFKAGSFKITPEVGLWKNFETVRALSDTFIDLNANFNFDKESEKRESYVIGAAGERKPTAADAPKSRMVVFGDATIISDAVVRNEGNIRFFYDGLQWVVGRAERQGELASEEDIEIRHTSKEDAIWFNGTVVVIPLTVLGAGFIATRRKGRGRKRKKSDQ